MKTSIGLLALLLTSALPSHTDATCVNQRAIHVQKNIIVPTYTNALVTYSTPLAYWSVGEQIRSEAEAERISNLVMKKLEQRLNLNSATSNGASNPIQQPQQPYGLTVLQANCKKCHSPTSKAVVEKRSPVLFDANGNLTVSQQEIGAMLALVKRGVMPPKPAEQLNDDDYLAVKVYLESGKAPVTTPARNSDFPKPPQPEQPGTSE